MPHGKPKRRNEQQCVPPDGKTQFRVRAMRKPSEAAAGDVEPANGRLGERGHERQQQARDKQGRPPRPLREHERRARKRLHERQRRGERTDAGGRQHVVAGDEFGKGPHIPHLRTPSENEHAADPDADGVRKARPHAAAKERVIDRTPQAVHKRRT